mmetsp:Transcript_20297/g.64819  ORF Transcript_20297/g.64819 Transcript_20297/m.64819 type:complete len:234 (-) Transcript_20297:26-727(-)
MRQARGWGGRAGAYVLRTTYVGAAASRHQAAKALSQALSKALCLWGRQPALVLQADLCQNRDRLVHALPGRGGAGYGLRGRDGPRDLAHARRGDPRVAASRKAIRLRPHEHQRHPGAILRGLRRVDGRGRVERGGVGEREAERDDRGQGVVELAQPRLDLASVPKLEHHLLAEHLARLGEGVRGEQPQRVAEAARAVAHLHAGLARAGAAHERHAHAPRPVARPHRPKATAMS